MRSMSSKNNTKMTRTDAREQTFILIFEKSFRDEPMSEIIELAENARMLTPNDYIRGVAVGTFDNIEMIDKQISNNLQGWKLERVSKVSLALLRLCIYEMFFEKDIPLKVSINEAVELCKKYAMPEDAAYINGVLGSISRSEENAKAFDASANLTAPEKEIIFEAEDDFDVQ